MEFVTKCRHCGEYYRNEKGELGAISCLCDTAGNGKRTLPEVGDNTNDWVACKEGIHRIRKAGTHYYNNGAVVHVTLLQGKFCKWCNRAATSLQEKIRSLELERI